MKDIPSQPGEYEGEEEGSLSIRSSRRSLARCSSIMFIPSVVERRNVRMPKWEENSDEIFGTYHILIALSVFTRALTYDHVKILTDMISSASQKSSALLNDPPFVSTKHLATQPRLIHLPGLIERSSTVLPPVSSEGRYGMLISFFSHHLILWQLKKGFQGKSWTYFLNTDYIRGDKRRYSLKHQVFCKGLCMA